MTSHTARNHQYEGIVQIGGNVLLQTQNKIPKINTMAILFPFKIENVDQQHDDYQAFQRKTNEQIIALINTFKKR